MVFKIFRYVIQISDFEPQDQQTKTAAGQISFSRALVNARRCRFCAPYGLIRDVGIYLPITLDHETDISPRGKTLKDVWVRDLFEKFRNEFIKHLKIVQKI